MSATPLNGSNDFVTGAVLHVVQPDGTAVPTSLSAPTAVNGNVGVVSGSFVRPANVLAYAVGSLVANSVTAASVVPVYVPVARINGASFTARRVHIKTNDQAWANATIRAHIYLNSPTFANGDGGTWLTTESEYLGYTDVTLDRVFSDSVKGFGVPSVGSEWNGISATGTQNVFVVLESRSAVTQGSATTFTVTAEVFQN